MWYLSNLQSTGSWFGKRHIFLFAFPKAISCPAPTILFRHEAALCTGRPLQRVCPASVTLFFDVLPKDNCLMLLKVQRNADPFPTKCLKRKQTNQGRYFSHSTAECERGGLRFRFTVGELRHLRRDDMMLPPQSSQSPSAPSPAATSPWLSLPSVCCWCHLWTCWKR